MPQYFPTCRLPGRQDRGGVGGHRYPALQHQVEVVVVVEVMVVVVTLHHQLDGGGELPHPGHVVPGRQPGPLLQVAGGVVLVQGGLWWCSTSGAKDSNGATIQTAQVSFRFANI